MNQSRIKVLLCDDDPIFLQLFHSYLANQPDLTIIGMVQNKLQLIDILLKTEIDVLLLDINLSGHSYDGIVCSLKAQQIQSDLKIIFLSSLNADHLIQDAMSFGKATNYIIKTCYRDVPDAIRNAYHGLSGIHYSTASALLKQIKQQSYDSLRKKVTPKQVEILKLLGRGYSRKEIAGMLCYTEQTINNEICKLSSLLKGRFPYLEWLRLKKHNFQEIYELAKDLEILR